MLPLKFYSENHNPPQLLLFQIGTILTKCISAYLWLWQLPPFPQRKCSSCYRCYVQLSVVGNQTCVTQKKYSVPSLWQRKLQN